MKVESSFCIPGTHVTRQYQSLSVRRQNILFTPLPLTYMMVKSAVLHCTWVTLLEICTLSRKSNFHKLTKSHLQNLEQPLKSTDPIIIITDWPSITYFMCLNSIWLSRHLLTKIFISFSHFLTNYY